MTITDAMKANLVRIRQPQWNDRAYFRLTVLEDQPDGKRMYGPWGVLFDPITEEACNIPPQQVLAIDHPCDEQDKPWEEYTGAVAASEGTAADPLAYFAKLPHERTPNLTPPPSP
jgi:hypothetical protein